MSAMALVALGITQIAPAFANNYCAPNGYVNGFGYNNGYNTSLSWRDRLGNWVNQNVAQNSGYNLPYNNNYYPNGQNYNYSYNYDVSNRINKLQNDIVNVQNKLANSNLSYNKRVSLQNKLANLNAQLNNYNGYGYGTGTVTGSLLPHCPISVVPSGFSRLAVCLSSPIVRAADAKAGPLTGVGTCFWLISQAKE
jgi:hypothetical protein